MSLLVQMVMVWVVARMSVVFVVGVPLCWLSQHFGVVAVDGWPGALSLVLALLLLIWRHRYHCSGRWCQRFWRCECPLLSLLLLLLFLLVLPALPFRSDSNCISCNVHTCSDHAHHMLVLFFSSMTNTRRRIVPRCRVLMFPHLWREYILWIHRRPWRVDLCAGALCDWKRGRFLRKRLEFWIFVSSSHLSTLSCVWWRGCILLYQWDSGCQQGRFSCHSFQSEQGLNGRIQVTIPLFLKDTRSIHGLNLGLAVSLCTFDLASVDPVHKKPSLYNWESLLVSPEWIASRLSMDPNVPLPAEKGCWCCTCTCQTNRPAFVAAAVEDESLCVSTSHIFVWTLLLFLNPWSHPHCVWLTGYRSVLQCEKQLLVIFIIVSVHRVQQIVYCQVMVTMLLFQGLRYSLDVME